MQISKGIDILLIIAVFAIGFLAGSGIGKNQPVGSDRVSMLEAELAQKTVILEKAKSFFPSSPEMFSVSGTINDIKGNVITVEMTASTSPFEELPTIREITITEKTALAKNEQKENVQYQREFIEWQRADSQMANGTIGVPPPSAFTENPIKLSELKIGDYVSAAAGENIKMKSSFEAQRVSVQSIVQLAAPIPPGAAAAK